MFGSLLRLTLLLSLLVALSEAHGAINDGDTGNTQNVPSVFPSEKHGTLAEGNIRLGFGLTALAAAASALGSLTPFLDSLFPLLPFMADFRITKSKGFLAGSFAFASGVLLALVLTDLYPEAISGYQNSGKFNKKFGSFVAAAVYIGTVLCIFIGKALFRKYKRRRVPDANEEYKSDIEKADEKIVENIDHHKMLKVGLQVAAALALHNFPEGLASFTTTIASAKIGVIFAIALALHKLPEGLIIALPIYFATGSRWKAFLIAASVGVISQFLGAILGYVLFVTYWNEAVSATMFAIVTGSLLYIVLHSMIPLARHYDPNNRYVTYYLFGGLFFFAIVSAIFDIA
ncbi:9506_t:CDS:2 [Paraglomus brasilianum]|uniref:9506_t:CDS:1 n=1 Tax=Paraglomus brasilianum TaxID=144538 RepID=A0A9N9F1M2_9GLOM|nr:9506_t:CDS:2 [Paraglomus brasilianum]